MLRATAIIRKAAIRPERVIDTVVLDHEARSRSPLALRSESGLDLVVDLGNAGPLNDGDAVKLEDGRLVQVRAASQALLEVRAENPVRLLRAAWQLGARHRAAEIGADALYVEDDPGLAELVRGQGCTATPVNRPFKPETEIHACGPDCGHDHGHGHHDHRHGHEHEHHHAHHHGTETGSHGQDRRHGHSHDH